MKRIILLMAILCPILIQAQTKIKVEATSQAGYEYNIPKNPSSYNDKGEDAERSELLLSSPLIKSTVNFDLNRKWNKKHYFYLDTDVDYKLYSNLMEANLLTLSVLPKYKYKFNKKWSFIQETQVKKTLLNGQLGENTFLTLLRPYTLYSFTSSIEYDIDRKQQITLEGGRNWKNYQSNGLSFLRYNEWNSGLEYRYRLSDKKLNQFDFSINWKKRNYTREGDPSLGLNDEIADIISENNSDNTSQFNLNYYSLGTGLKFKLNKKITLRNNYDFLIRTSPSNQNLTYRQIKTGISLNYSHKNTILKWRNSVYYRHYNKREIDVENGLNLKYYFLKSGVELEQKIGKKLYFVASTGIIKRISNHPDDNRLINRSYLNSFGMVGIRMKF